MCIYVREITNEEGNRLKYILRRSSDKVKVKRAQIILASAQSMKVPEICKTLVFIEIMYAELYTLSMKKDLKH